MPSIRVIFNWRRYRVDLNPSTGAPIRYAVEVSARGKRTTERTLWEGVEGDSANPMPQQLKGILNVSGVSESIAYVMGWNEG